MIRGDRAAAHPVWRSATNKKPETRVGPDRRPDSHRILTVSAFPGHDCVEGPSDSHHLGSCRGPSEPSWRPSWRPSSASWRPLGPSWGTAPSDSDSRPQILRAREGLGPHPSSPFLPLPPSSLSNGRRFREGRCLQGRLHLRPQLAVLTCGRHPFFGPPLARLVAP